MFVPPSTDVMCQIVVIFTINWFMSDSNRAALVEDDEVD